MRNPSSQYSGLSARGELRETETTPCASLHDHNLGVFSCKKVGDGTVRLHHEDFCQALGVPSARKYQAEGGPSLADRFALVRRATAVPAREVIKLLDDVALNFLVGNHEPHGNNFSLLYLPESGHAVLSPAYDVLSTFAYRSTTT
jgi:hypothetical protein